MATTPSSTPWPAAAPIRIAAGAWGDGVPARDLVLSPDHGLLPDGALAPVRLLVNGTTIAAEAARAATADRAAWRPRRTG